MRFNNFIVFCAFSLLVTLPAAAQEVSPGATPPPIAQPGQLSGTISAPPFTAGDKFDYRVVQTFGLRGVAGSAVGALFGQAFGTPYEWGGGFAGYGRRFASNFGGNISRQVFAATLDVAFHEDPRYFPSHDKNKKARIANVLKQAVFTKTDSGGDSFAYSRVISAFGAAEVVNTWQPKSNNSQLDAVERGFITLAGDTAYNLLQEFFPFTRPSSLRHRH